MFHPSGMSILLAGPRPFYYTYDLQTGATHRSPRGLLGTTFAGSNPAAQDGSMEVCSFDSSGSVLAVAGRRGHVHLVDWRAGGGQVVGDVKNASTKDLSRFNYIIVQDLSDLPPGIARDDNLDNIVTVNWVKDCLISGRLLPARIV